jgi:hypothetical protein
MSWQDFQGMQGIPPTLLEDALKTAVDNGLVVLLAWNPYACVEEGEEHWEFFPDGARDLFRHSRVLFAISAKGSLSRVTE